MSPSPGNIFAHQESLRCQLLRQMARRYSANSRGSAMAYSASSVSKEEATEDLAQPVQPVKSLQPVQRFQSDQQVQHVQQVPPAPLPKPVDQNGDRRPQPVQPVTPMKPVEEHIEDVIRKAPPPSAPKQMCAWQYPGSDWRKHPTVKKYQDEAFLFIPCTSYPTESEATVPLIAWLRHIGRLCSPPRKPLHSGVVRVEGAGWIITLGNMSGALDRMTRLLDSKAGQRLSYKGRMHIIWMETSLPLEWMP